MGYFFAAVLACLAAAMITRRLACSTKDSRGEFIACLCVGAVSVPVLLSVTYYTLYTDLPLIKEASIWIELAALGFSTATVMVALKAFSWGIQKVNKLFRWVYSRFGKVAPSVAFAESGS